MASEPIEINIQQQTQGGNTVEVRTQTQHDEFTFADETENFFSQITLEAPSFEMTSRPAVDIVAVLDVSGSMSGEKMSLVRKSMRRLVRSMGSRDRVAFVTFDSYVNVLMNFCEMTEDNKQNTFQVIKQLTAGSCTNLCGGVTTGVDMLLKNRVNELAAVILFTDGEANEGISDTHGIINEVMNLTSNKINLAKSSVDVENWTVDDVGRWLQQKGFRNYVQKFRELEIEGSIVLHDLNEELLRNDLEVKSVHIPKFLRELTSLRNQVMGEEGVQQNTEETNTNSEGFRLHTFGFGASHNTTLLQTLAERFEGMYYYMEDEEAIKAGFANCLGGLLSTVAQNIDVSIQFNPALTNCKVHKDNCKVDSEGEYHITFADLQSEEKRDILISCTLPALQEPSEDYLLFEVTTNYDNTIIKNQENVVVQCELNRSGAINGFCEKIDETKNRILATQALEEAARLGDKNDLEAARNKLNECINSIETSVTHNTPTSVNLTSDLRNAIAKCRSRSQYLNEGNQYLVQNYMCHNVQRACNFKSFDYAAQAQYNTGFRSAMKHDFEEEDSQDSDFEDYS